MSRTLERLVESARIAARRTTDAGRAEILRAFARSLLEPGWRPRCAFLADDLRVVRICVASRLLLDLDHDSERQAGAAAALPFCLDTGELVEVLETVAERRALSRSVEQH